MSGERQGQRQRQRQSAYGKYETAKCTKLDARINTDVGVAKGARSLKSLIVKANLQEALNANASYEQQTMWQLPMRRSNRGRNEEGSEWG